MIVNKIDELSKKDKVEDNLYVNNIIVKKENTKKQVFPYIATEKWISQLGVRLHIN